MQVSDAEDQTSSGDNREVGQTEALCGIIVLITMLNSFVWRYQAVVGHVSPPVFAANPGFISCQAFFAIAAWRAIVEVTSGRTALRYALARYERFVPVVVPAVALSAGAAWLMGLPHAFAGWTGLAANLAMAGDFTGAGDGLGAFWRVKIELMFAAGFGLVWFGSRRRTGFAILMLCLGLCALLPAGEPKHQPYLSAIGLLTMDGYLPAFATSLALYFLANGGRKLVWMPVLTVAAALVLRANDGWHGVAVLAADGLVALAAIGALPWLGGLTALRALGRVFFGVFYVHLLPGFAVIHALEAAGAPPPVAIAGAMVAVIALGAVMQVKIASKLREVLTPVPSRFSVARRRRGRLIAAAECLPG
jgi:hypothetical protein